MKYSSARAHSRVRRRRRRSKVAVATKALLNARGLFKYSALYRGFYTPFVRSWLEALPIIIIFTVELNANPFDRATLS